MPNEMEIRPYRPIIVEIPDPGERYLSQYVHSEVSHSFVPKTPISTLGENWPGGDVLPDTITVGITHAIS